MKKFQTAQHDIFLGSIHEGLAEHIQSKNPSSLICITDENTHEHCLPRLNDLIFQKTITLPAGENTKQLNGCTHIWNALIETGADRNTLIINLGGGMVCDLGGFAAACYQRGVSFVHIPTSLMAMADAALGGKNGIDFNGLKNYIGTFHPPSSVWIDPVFLETLPRQEFLSGMAEVIKHAIIDSEFLFQKLEAADNVFEVDRDMMLHESIRVKMNIIQKDPFEDGLRKVLNFGHTIGHAVESWFLHHNTPLPHGQCVALGIMAESKMAFTMGMLNVENFHRISTLVERLLGPFPLTLPTFEAIRQWIEKDKKNIFGKVAYSLPDAIGSCQWNVMVDQPIAKEAYDWLCAQAPGSSQRY